MKFLIAVIDNATGTATGDEMAAIDAFNESLQANGHWIMACGISSPEAATVIDNRFRCWPRHRRSTSSDG